MLVEPTEFLAIHVTIPLLVGVKLIDTVSLISFCSDDCCGRDENCYFDAKLNFTSLNLSFTKDSGLP